MTPAQQRWLRTVIQSIFTMGPPGEGHAREERQERPRGAPAREQPPSEQPRRKGLDELLSGEGSLEEAYPELAEELKGIADIVDLLKESGSARRRFGEELMRLLEDPEPPENAPSDEEDDDLTAG